MEGCYDLGSHMVGWQTLRLENFNFQFDIAKCTVASLSKLIITFKRQLA